MLAFPQADIKFDIYMHLPFGFEPPDDGKQYVLKLKKNLYGLKDTSRTFWEKVQETLTRDSEGYGFKQSRIETCLFIRDNCFVLAYVDDILCFSRDSKVLDRLIEKLKCDFELTDEGEVNKYLGVDVKKHNNGDIDLRQPFLIEREI